MLVPVGGTSNGIHLTENDIYISAIFPQTHAGAGADGFPGYEAGDQLLCLSPMSEDR